MAEFLAAVAVFMVAHVVPPAPPVRTRLIAWLGRRAYIIGYSTLSVLLIVWLITAARGAPYVPLWSPAPWQALVPIALMPLAAWLLVAGLVEPNPLSISLRAVGPETELGVAASVTRHPVLWAFLLWAGSHIVPNGNVVALVLFGGMVLLALAGFAVVDRRARQRLGEERWQALSASTSIVPFAAILSGRAKMTVSARLLLSLAIAIALYLWFLLDGHQRFIGLDPLMLLRS